MRRNPRGRHEVSIARKPFRFSGLPTWARRGIIQGRERVERIRSEIAFCAKISTMPPVRIVDVGWVTPSAGGMICARSGPIRIGGTYWFGVELPAPTVIFPDDDTLRRILVHEFAHCFFYLRRAIESTGGEIRFERDPYDERDDRAFLADPDDWFGERDVREFTVQHDEILEKSHALFDKRWVDGGLPVETPEPQFRIDQFGVPDPVAEHVQRLQRGRGNE